jgi:SAM-dependent methyltransferase
VPRDWLSRDDPSCACGSTARFRALVHVLSTELFQRSLALDEFPETPDLAVLDMSGWEGYAHRLRRKVAYSNTYLHREPRLDIAAAIPPGWRNRFDVVICSEVLEHVDPPVGDAFGNLRELLKPGGLLLLTVPYSRNDETREHFPELFRHRLVRRSGKRCLYNVTRDGREQWFEDLVFHGGPGATLELRVFARGQLRRELAVQGFMDICCHEEWVPEVGALWGAPDGCPITARRPHEFSSS